MADGSTPSITRTSLAGSVPTSAAFEPGYVGKPDGTLSQIGPHSVSVWPAVGPAAARSLGAASDASAVADALAGGDDGVPEPQAVNTRHVSRTTTGRQHDITREAYRRTPSWTWKDPRRPQATGVPWSAESLTGSPTGRRRSSRSSSPDRLEAPRRRDVM